MIGRSVTAAARLARRGDRPRRRMIGEIGIDARAGGSGARRTSSPASSEATAWPSRNSTALPTIAGTRGPGAEDADEVQRIGRRDRHASGAVGRVARRAQLVERLGQRELLADEAAHEPTAADLAARLEPAQRDEHVAPRRQARLARDADRGTRRRSGAGAGAPTASASIASGARRRQQRPAARRPSAASAARARPPAIARARALDRICHLRTGGAVATALSKC